MKFFGLLATILVPLAQSAMPNLLRLYRGDGDLTDSAGSGHDLANERTRVVTYVNDHPYNTSRQAFELVDQDHLLSRTGGLGLPIGNSPRTMMGWMKTYDFQINTGRHGRAFGYGHAGPHEMFVISHGKMGTATTDSIYIDVHSNDEFGDGTMGLILPLSETDQWTHIAVTWDETTLKAYVNGVLKNYGEPQDEFETRAHLNYGPAVGYNNFEGSVADFAIFDTALSEENILAIFRNGFNVDGTIGSGDNTLPFFEAYNISTAAQSSQGNDMQFQYSLGPNVTNVKIDILEKTCTNPVSPADIITYDGSPSTGQTYEPQVVMNAANFTFGIDTSKLDDPSINIATEGSDTTTGSLEFCVKVQAFDENLSLSTDTSSNPLDITLTSIKTKYKVDYDGNQQFYGPFTLDVTIEQADIIDGADGGLTLENLTVTSYLCSEDDIEEVSEESTFEDFIYLCVTPDFDDQEVEVKSLEVSYNTGAPLTMVLKDDTFEAEFIDISPVENDKKILQKIRVPVLAAFRENGNTDLTFSGNAFVSFSTPGTRAKATKVADFGMRAKLSENPPGCFGMLFSKVNALFV